MILAGLTAFVCLSVPCVGQTYATIPWSARHVTALAGAFSTVAFSTQVAALSTATTGSCDSTPDCAGCTQVCRGYIETTTRCCTKCAQGPSAVVRDCGAPKLLTAGLVLLRGQNPEGGALFHLLIPPDIGLELTSSQTETGASGTAFEYRLLNAGNLPIVAINVSWTTYLGSQPAVISNQMIDYWMAGPKGWLQPRQEMELWTSSGRVFGKVRLTKIEGTVTYVEFADGSVLGEDAASISAQRATFRAALQTECRNLIAAYRQGGEAAMTRELMRAKASKQSAPQDVAGLVRSRMITAKGLTQALTDLTRIASLPIPRPSGAQ